MSATDSPRPNVIWIFGDQHRAQALGLAGDPNLHTPNIDQLAVEGMWFRNAVGGCPLSSPCRGSMLTGRYPHNAVPGHEYPIPDGMPTVAEPFNDAGYHTCYLGKWHIDGWHERDGRAGLHIVPKSRRGGFQKWIGYENNNSQWDCHVHGHDEDGNEVERFQLPGFETDVLTDMTIDYIGRRADDKQPFFCVLSVQPPHDPYQAPEQFMQRHTPGGVQLRENVPDIPRITDQARRELAGYYAMIENIDWNVGRIVQTLRDRDMLGHTHIIFFSDHGDMHGSHGMFRKTNPYEESLRVPCIIGGGGSRYAGKNGSSDVPFNHVDFGPTSLGLCGIEVPDYMEGTDWSAHRLHGKQPVENAPDSAFCQLVVPTRHGNSTDRPWRGIVTADGWKYAVLEHQPWLLFNLNEDPYEQVNLAHNSMYDAKRTELQAKLQQWIETTGDQFPLPEL